MSCFVGHPVYSEPGTHKLKTFLVFKSWEIVKPLPNKCAVVIQRIDIFPNIISSPKLNCHTMNVLILITLKFLKVIIIADNEHPVSKKTV